ncbi:GTP-binding protein EsdC [Drechmeria coniospora]|uniref:GTP-binding protein EsdC n=1 Tax=Drechmeria coniospora TaxID=98403 RepID=A0A151GTH1_DRECN|nr:GTP-binding protein EsdC [Drechmeria coniospora]KYK60405.1 GTP-binding protein EsdC [Drechmeria coniospora]
MSAVQLSFSLRVSSTVKAVHLLGSWDNYVGQLPLSKDRKASKSGSWKGTFRFQNSTLSAGQRYWYYYIIDGYHVAHDPSIKSTTEPTTGRELNILDVPSDRHHTSSSSSRKSSSSSSSSKSSSSHKSTSKASSSSKASSHKSNRKSSSSSSSSASSSSRQHSPFKDHHLPPWNRAELSVDIPKGRPLSVSRIQAPKPMTPHVTKHILDCDYYDSDALAELTARFGNAALDDEDLITNLGYSPVSTTGSSLSYRSGSSSPNSPLSGYSTPNSDSSACTCERYGITRKGERVRLDCGGSFCGYEDDGSSCSSGSGEDEYGPQQRYSRTTSSRRNGIHVC